MKRACLIALLAVFACKSPPPEPAPEGLSPAAEAKLRAYADARELNTVNVEVHLADGGVEAQRIEKTPEMIAAEEKLAGALQRRDSIDAELKKLPSISERAAAAGGLEKLCQKSFPDALKSVAKLPDGVPPPPEHTAFCGRDKAEDGALMLDYLTEVAPEKAAAYYEERFLKAGFTVQRNDDDGWAGFEYGFIGKPGGQLLISPSGGLTITWYPPH